MYIYIYIYERVDTGWFFKACRNDVFVQYMLMPRDDVSRRACILSISSVSSCIFPHTAQRM